MCRPMLKRRGLTEKVGAFRAERTVKVVPLELIELGKMGALRKSAGAFRANRTEKVGAPRANKTQTRGPLVLRTLT